MTGRPAAGDYAVREARPGDLAALPAIERAAAALFRATPFAFLADFPLAATAIDLARERVWVAVGDDDRPVGFAIAHPLDGAAYLRELDVHPDHGRRGLGRRLVAAVAGWGRASGADAVTLVTFRDIPWNGPFYARLGFRPLAEDELTPGLRAIRAAERAAGLPVAARVCLRRDLASRRAENENKTQPTAPASACRSRR